MQLRSSRLFFHHFAMMYDECSIVFFRDFQTKQPEIATIAFGKVRFGKSWRLCKFGSILVFFFPGKMSSSRSEKGRMRSSTESDMPTLPTNSAVQTTYEGEQVTLSYKYVFPLIAAFQVIFYW